MIIEPAWDPDDFESQYPSGLPTWIFKREKKKIHKSLIILSDSIIDIDPISYINIALLQSI